MKNKGFKFKILKFLLLSFNLICLILLIFGYFIIQPNLVVTSGESMMPTIKPNNALIFNKQEKYNLFDIIAFKQNGIVIVHRIIDIKAENNCTYYICSGDNIIVEGKLNQNEKHQLVKDLTLSKTSEISGIQVVEGNEILGKINVNSAFLGFLIRFRLIILVILLTPIVALILKKLTKIKS